MRVVLCVCVYVHDECVQGDAERTMRGWTRHEACRPNNEYSDGNKRRMHLEFSIALRAITI